MSSPDTGHYGERTIKHIESDKLERDQKYNPRKKPPNEEMKENVRKHGIRNPLVVRTKNENKFLIGDGWQRFQAGMNAGISEYPCEVYKDSEELDEYKNEIYTQSLQRDWTTYERLMWVGRRVEEHINDGMTESDAINKVENTIGRKKSTVRRYWRICSLPESIRLLTKKKNDLTEDEVNKLKKRDSSIMQRYSKLWMEIAEDIARLREEKTGLDGLVSKHAWKREKQIAFSALNMSKDEAKIFVKKSMNNKNASLRKIKDEIVTNTRSDRNRFDLGKHTFDDDEYELIKEYIGEKRKDVKELSKELLLGEVKHWDKLKRMNDK